MLPGRSVLTGICQAINKLLHDNEEHSYAPRLLLADTYDNIPDYDGDGLKGTAPSVDASWRSPFVGKTVQDAVDWMRSIPKPPKPINKTFCAAVKKDLYEERGKALICKWVEDAEPQTITYSAGMVGSFVVNFSRGDWDESWRENNGIPHPPESP